MLDYQREIEDEKLHLQMLKERKAVICRRVIPGVPVFLAGAGCLAFSLEMGFGFLVLFSCLFLAIGFTLIWTSYIHSGLKSAVSFAKKIGYSSLHIQIEESGRKIETLKGKLQKDMVNRKDYYEAKENTVEEIYNPVNPLTDEQVLEIMEKAKKIEQPGVQNRKKTAQPDEEGEGKTQSSEAVKAGAEQAQEEDAKEAESTGEEKAGQPEEENRKAKEEKNVMKVEYL